MISNPVAPIVRRLHNGEGKGSFLVFHVREGTRPLSQSSAFCPGMGVIECASVRSEPHVLRAVDLSLKFPVLIWSRADPLRYLRQCLLVLRVEEPLALCGSPSSRHLL